MLEVSNHRVNTGWAVSQSTNAPNAPQSRSREANKNLQISMSQKSQCHRNASQSTDALNAMQCIPKSKQGSKQAPTKNCRSQCHKNMNITKISMSQKCIVMLSMHPKVIAGRGKQAPTKNCRSQCHNLQL